MIPRLKKYFPLVLLLTMVNCEDLDDFNPSNLNDVFDLTIKNNNSPADGISKIKVIATLMDDFKIEDDGKVDFIIFKDAIENESNDIVFTSSNGEDKRISELLVSHNQIKDIEIRASVTSNNARISKDTVITFARAYPDSINIFSNVLTLTSGTFDQIDLTTELTRKLGAVNINSVAETKVVDTIGNRIGIFSNYNNQTDSSGKITNKYSLAGNGYLGKLYAIATSTNTDNITLLDTITLFSIPKE